MRKEKKKVANLIFLAGWHSCQDPSWDACRKVQDLDSEDISFEIPS